MVTSSGLFESRVEGELGEVEYVKPAIGLMDTPGGIRRRAPYLGEDNERVYGQLGLTKEELERLKEEGVI